jgi:hypothetical protein
MALIPDATLQHVRKRVLAGLSMGQQAEYDSLLAPEINELIRKAQRHLYFQAPWTRLEIEKVTPLTDGVSVYDWPDDAQPGQIEWIYLIDDEFAPTRTIELQRGIRPNEAVAFGHSTSGSPYRYDYIDQTIHIVPAPNADTWTHMKFRYFRSENPLTSDSDVISVDEQALVDYTSILYKSSKEEDIRLDMAMFQQYLNTVRAQQGVGGKIHVGGHFAGADHRGDTRNLAIHSRTAHGYPYYRTWGM